MGAIERISIDSSVCGGRPTIRGLRIRVKDVLDLPRVGRNVRFDAHSIPHSASAASAFAA